MRDDAVVLPRRRRRVPDLLQIPHDVIVEDAVPLGGPQQHGRDPRPGPDLGRADRDDVLARVLPVPRVPVASQHRIDDFVAVV